MSDNKQNPKETHEAKAQVEGAGGASQPPAHGAKKPLTREEYNKLPTRVKRKLGNLKPPIDRLSATPDNFKLFLRDIKELYYVVDNYCMLLPKVEKYSQAGVAAVVMQNMNELLDLLHTIIFSDAARVGIPIGNYTSQYFANIYLNKLDQYCKHNLGVKYYVRYMDDFIILAPNKRKAKQWYRAIQRYAESYLHLKLNPKSCFYPSSHGLDFVGYKMTHSCLRLRQRSKRKLNNIIWNYQHDYTTEADFVTSVAAWLGHAGHANAKTYIRKRLWSYRDMLLKHWKSAGPRAFFTKKAKSDEKVKTVGEPTTRPSAAV